MILAFVSRNAPVCSLGRVSDRKGLTHPLLPGAYLEVHAI